MSPYAVTRHVGDLPHPCSPTSAKNLPLVCSGSEVRASEKSWCGSHPITFEGC
jgi:hypothetical protein